MAHTCKNHPDRPAARRCYYCKERFCSDCVSVSFHHYFCGIRCKVLFLAGDIVSKIRSFASGIFRKKHAAAKKGVSAFAWIQALVCLLLLVNLFTVYRLNQRINGLGTDVEALNRSVADAAALRQEAERIPDDLPVVDSPASHETNANTASISGSGSDAYTLLLYINGELYGGTSPRNGRFSFPAVPLEPGENRIRIKAAGPDNRIYELEEFAITYRPPHLDEYTIDTNRGDKRLPMIALTFDGGSNAAHADKIISLLNEKDAPATFFLTGEFIRCYPEIASRLAAGSHEIGNHTFSHPHLTTFEENSRHDTRGEITRKLIHGELSRTDSLFHAVTGRHMAPYWRSPFGEQNREIRTWAAEAGYRHIGWTRGGKRGENMDTRDWVSDESSELYMTAEEIRDALLEFGKDDEHGANGAIVLMHLGSTRKDDFLYERLPEIIDEFRQRGYTLCTIGQLLAAKNE